MTSAGNRARAELTKFATDKPLWLLPLATIALTWSLTYLAGLSELAATGGDLAGATSENNPLLYAAEPLPLEFQGFDMMNIGLVLVVALGALYAGSEYSAGLIRSSLIADPARLRLFATKAAVLLAVILVTGILAMGVGTVIRHLALGDSGLDPLAFPPLVWRNLAGVLLCWTVLGLMSFGIGVLARNPLVPLIVTIPFVVGIGDFLLTLWAPARFLPPAAGSGLFTPADGTHLEAGTGALVMAAWAIGSAALAGFAFTRRDTRPGRH